MRAFWRQLFGEDEASLSFSAKGQSGRAWSSAPYRLLILGLCVLTIPMTSHANAQNLPLTISSIQIEPDRNGVNIVDGKMTPDALVLSVPAAPRLKFDRVQNAAPYVKGEQYINNDTGAESTGSWTVHTIDGASEAFRCGSDIDGLKVCQSVSGSGSSLTYSGRAYRKAGSGERYDLGLTHVFTTPAQGDFNTQRVRLFYASKIEYPDGEVLSYSYGIAYLVNDPYNRPFFRPIRVSTNLGYYLTISYAQNDLTQPGWGSPNEVTLYKASDPSTPLARLTDNGSGTITDLAGRTYAGYTLGTMGQDVESASFSKTLPTETTPTLTVAPIANLPPSAQMISSVNRDGVQWNYSYTNPQYDAVIGGYLYDAVNVTGPNGYQRAYTITKLSSLSPAGARNLITRTADEAGRQTNYTYDQYLRVTQIQAPELNSVAIAWDVAGNIVSKTTSPKPGSGLSNLVEQTSFNLAPFLSVNGVVADCKASTMCWRPVWHRDALNRQTDFAYNTIGQLTEQTDPADADGVRRKTYIEYETLDTGAGVISRRKRVRMCGQTTTCGTNAEVRVEYDYFEKTFLPTTERRVDLASGQVRETRYSYDSAGRVVSVDGPRPGFDDAVYSRYDVLGRKTWEIGAMGPNGLRLAKRFTYRAADDQVSLVEAGTVPNATSTTLTVLDRTDFSFDSRRNIIREAMSSGSTTYRVTDKSFLDRGLADCATIRMNLSALPAASGTAACSLGTAGTQGPDRITKNVYDTAGRLERIQRAFGTPLVQNYVTYGYTPNGKTEFVTDAKGNKAQLKYDGYDRQTHWNFPDKVSVGTVSVSDYEQYGYDAVGNRVSLRKRDGRVLTYSYDNRNRVISKVIPDGCAPIQAGPCPAATATRDVYYRYDVHDRQLSAKFDAALGSDGLTSIYDTFGNLLSSTISMDGFTRSLTAGYDEAFNRSRLTHPDGRSFTYVYDALQRLSGVYEGGDTTVPLAQFGYNTRGLLSSRSERFGSAVNYTYDPIGRLITQADTFVGATGNVTVSGVGYNPAWQMVSKSRDNDSYAWRDAIVVSRSYATNGLNQYMSAGPAAFGYDANGNLVSDGTSSFGYDAENRLISSSSGATLTYDPMGRLWRLTRGGLDTRFLYDGDALVAEYDALGQLTSRYVHGSNNAADDPLVSYAGNSANWLHSDHQGSIVAATNASGGAPTINTYDEYGIPGATNSGRFQYTGQAWLAEIGLYYYKARIYSPTLGRFLQVDPIGYDDQINLYAYVGNDPVNGTDPTGLLKCDGDSRCDSVHDAADQARTALAETSQALRGLAEAIDNGGELSEAQSGLKEAFEKKFGEGSGTTGGLNRVAGRLDRAFEKIGAHGEGSRVRFGGPSATAVATATLGGNRITIHDGFFSHSNKGFVIAHEAGHLAGLNDRDLPSNAPYGLGINGKAYGNAATNWLGANDPKRALRNNDSHICLVIQCYQ